MKLNKRLAGILLAGFLALNINNYAYADFVKLYENTTESRLSKGATFKTISRFYDHGWVNINILDIDLTDKNTELKILGGKPMLSNRLPLSIMAEMDKDNIIGAINGDFFDTRTSESIGPMILDGELLSSSKNDGRFSVFTLDDNNNADIGYWLTQNMSVINTSGNKAIKLDYYNKAIKDNSLLYIDSNWRSETFGYTEGDILEIIVKDNKVSEIRYNQPAIPIPEDGYSLVATGARATEVANSFRKGNKLKIQSNLPNIEDIKVAMGGGGKILSDGVLVSPISLPVGGRHPRSALGISRDEKHLYLVAIDGRKNSNPGLTQEELASIMLELGAYNAVNLDGGGSTEMLVKQPNNYIFDIVNNPSSGYERSIANGLGVINTSEESSFKDLAVNVSDSNVFVGTSREITLTGYDKNFNPYNINLDRVNFKVEGVEGHFKNNVFYPTTAGDASVSINYMGVEKVLRLKVLDKAVELTMSPQDIPLDKIASTDFDIKLKNANGYSAKLDMDYVNLSFNDDRISSIDDLSKIDSIKSPILITATYGDLTSYSRIANFYTSAITEDFEIINGTFAGYPATVQGSYELSKKSYGGNTSAMLSYDFTNVNANKAAYFIFNNGGKVLMDDTRRISLMVYGNQGNNHWLRAKVIDGEGTSHNLTLARNIDWNGWKQISTEIPSSFPRPIKIERIYVVEPDLSLAGTGRIYFDTLKEFRLNNMNAPIPEKVVGEKNIPLIEDTIAEGDFSFSVIGKVTSMNTMLDNYLASKLSHHINDNDINIVFEPNDSLKDKLINDSLYVSSNYKKYDYANTTFLELKNDTHGLRSSDYTQWTWLFNIKDSINTKNVFVLLPNKFDFKDKKEEELFMNILNELKSAGKNICVISGGDNNYNNIDIRDGIYYVSLRSYPNGIEDYEAFKYLSIVSGESGIKFKYNGLFNKQ